MPFKFETEKTPMPEGKDRRVKLTEEQRAEILKNFEGKSQRALAKEYGVSRRLISFIQDPQKQKQNLERREARGGWSQYYVKEKNTKSIREHRQYKKKVIEHE